MLNWDEIANGSWPDNNTFAALPDDKRIETIDAALRLSIRWQTVDPIRLYRVAGAALHLMDSTALREPELRLNCALMLAVAAANMPGRAHEGEMLLRKVIADAEGHDAIRIQALAALGGVLTMAGDSQAEAVLRQAAEEANAAGMVKTAASLAISLGIIQRRNGDPKAARNTYQQALARLPDKPLDDPVQATIIGRLYGNLANVLTDDLQQHHEAIACYRSAITSFLAAGEADLVAQRTCNLAQALMAAGDHAEALQTLKSRAPQPSALRQLLMFSDWLAIPLQELAAWDSWLRRMLEPSTLDDETSAALIAARIIIASRQRPNHDVIRLFWDDRICQLPPSDLREILLSVVRELPAPGVLWQLPWLVEQVGPGERDFVKRMFLQDKAELWLFELASAEDQDSAAQSVLHGPAIVGLGALPAEPSRWLESDPGTAERYRQLRALLPPAKELEQRYDRVFEQVTDVSGQGIPEAIDQIRECVSLADLLGSPSRQVRSRMALASALSRGSGGRTSETYLHCLELVDEARAAADRLPRTLITLHIAAATLLKEADFGGEATRIARAVVEARQALELATQHGFNHSQVLASIALANALAEGLNATIDQLREAQQVLGAALSLLEKLDDQDDRNAAFLEGTIRNSLGTTLLRLWEEQRSEAELDESLPHLERAVQLRQLAGDSTRELLSLGNLIGAMIKFGEAKGVRHPRLAEIIARVRQVAAGVQYVAVRAPALLNAAVMLRDAGHREAVELADDALALLRLGAASKNLIKALDIASTVREHFDDPIVALEYLEQAQAVIEEYRRGGGDSRHRASLTETFEHIHASHLRLLERTGKSHRQMWWAVERATSRTLLENIGGPTPDEETVTAALARHLPTDTVVVQLYNIGKLQLGGALLRSEGGSLHMSMHRHRIELSELAVATGGELTATQLSLPRYTPGHSEEFDFQIAWLGRNLLDPLLAEVDAATVHRVVIVPRGMWWDWPWHAMPLPSRGKPLGQAFSVLQMPSCAILANALGRPARALVKAAFIACDPIGNLRQHISECRHAFMTLDIPEKVILTDTSRLVSTDAFIETMLDADLVHFSGHSTMRDGEPERSGLLLSDGMLTIPALETALQRHSPEVVFLSSCDSSRGDMFAPDAPDLSRAFLQAGTKVVVGSPWPVPDAIAAFTAERFYKRLISSDPITALTSAQRELRESVGTDYWSSFRLHGWA